MAAKSLGKTTITPGTPKRITSNQSDPAATLTCASIMVQTLSSSTGKVYVGLPHMDKTTLVGVLAVLPAPTANSLPAFSMGHPGAMAAFNAAEIFIDGDSTSDGALSSYVR